MRAGLHKSHEGKAMNGTLSDEQLSKRAFSLMFMMEERPSEL